MVFKCDNCEKEVEEWEDLKPLAFCDDLSERLTANCPTPAGECKECGCFSYLVEEAPEPVDFLAIAKKHFFSVDTLETRNRDRLDFHDVSVWGIKAALEEAYEAGVKHGRR
jgi:hypothetical protein